MTHDDYPTARKAAQCAADLSGLDVALMRCSYGEGWRTHYLPRRENRSGHELTCEVVHPSNLWRCKPGHGPEVAP